MSDQNSSQQASSAGFYEDPTYVAIHDAFMLGWSLYELKCRVVIEALNVSLTTDIPNPPADSNSSTPKNPATRAAAHIDGLLEEIKPLIHMRKPQQQPTDDASGLPIDLSTDPKLTNVWRAMFNRIVALHLKRFPNSSTKQTVYDVALDRTAYSYLTSGSSVFIDVGISKYVGNTQFADQFQLYNVTRRALNCLTLLHANIEESLIPDILGPYRNQLVQDTMQQVKQNSNSQAAPTQVPPNTTNQTSATQDGSTAATGSTSNSATSQTSATQGSSTTAATGSTSNGATQDSGTAAATGGNTSATSQTSATQGSSTTAATGSTNGATQEGSAANTSNDVQLTSVLMQDKAPKEPTHEEINKAIKIYSGLVIHFLEAWDGFLRESFYADSGSADNQSVSTINEIELMAYEAARSLASLSWGISVRTAPIEEALQGRKHGEGGHIIHLHKIWTDVFNQHDINRIQHQVSTLSTALDEAYYRTNKTVQKPDADTTLKGPNPDLPSEAIHAIKHSIDYWQKTIALICNSDAQNQGQTDQNQPTSSPAAPAKHEVHHAQNQGQTTQNQSPASPVAPAKHRVHHAQNQGQTDQNQPPSSPVAPAKHAIHLPFVHPSKDEASVTPTAPDSVKTVRRSPLPMLTWETSAGLRQALIQQANVWQSLLLCQQTLRAYTIDSVTQTIVADFMDSFEQALSKVFFQDTEKTFRATLERHRIIIFAAGIGLVLIVILLVVLVLPLLKIPNANPLTFVTSTAAILLGIISSGGAIVAGMFNRVSGGGASAPPAGADETSLFPRFAGIIGSAEAAVFNAFQKGYEQILIEFGALNHFVSVAFPLIEFFIDENFRKLHNHEIRNAYDFLTKVIWTDEERQEEIQRVARAAFGPIGAFVGTQLNPGNNSPSPNMPQKPTGNPPSPGQPTKPENRPASHS